MVRVPLEDVRRWRDEARKWSNLGCTLEEAVEHIMEETMEGGGLDHIQSERELRDFWVAVSNVCRNTGIAFAEEGSIEKVSVLGEPD